MSYEPIFDEFTAPDDDRNFMGGTSCKHCGTFVEYESDNICESCWSRLYDPEDV